MFVTPAYAQAGGNPFAPDALVQFLPILIIFGIMYFLIIRPQQARQKQHREMIKAVRRGDTIVTSGGIIATVSKVVDDAELLVEIAPNIKVRLQRAMVADVRAKGEPVKDDA
ncbi:MAG: preprotein translocase subunit YajC [Bauldia sp.]